MRTALLGTAVAGVLLLAGCSSAPPSSVLDKSNASLETSVPALQRQVQGLRAILDDVDVWPDDEPRGRVADGYFEAEIDDVTSSPAIVADLVTAESKPGTDSHYWNRYQFRQRFPVAPDAVFAVRMPDDLQVVSFMDFERQWRAYQDSDIGYWVRVRDGQVVTIWETWVP